MLLTSAGLLIRSFERLLAVDPGFSPRKRRRAAGLRRGSQRQPRQGAHILRAAIERLRATPGVESAGAVSAMPLSARTSTSRAARYRRPAATAERRSADCLRDGCDARLFRAMTIPLRGGRFLELRDSQTAAPVAVITEALRNREWPDESQVGTPHSGAVAGSAGQGGDRRRREPDRHDGLDRAPRPEVFLSLDQNPFASMTYAGARRSGSPQALVDAAKREVWTVDPQQTSTRSSRPFRGWSTSPSSASASA